VISVKTQKRKAACYGEEKVSGLSAVIIAVIIAAIVFGAISEFKRKGVGTSFYERQNKLFSAAELSFLAVLDQAISPGQRVMGKVRVADLIAIRSGLNTKTRQIALNRVAQKHIDFVVCAGPSLTPVCAIELNDGSHNSSAARQRDEFLSSVCAQVGLPLIVVKAGRTYARDTIRQQITAVIPVEQSPMGG
jgi:hypothetical protein